MFKSLRLKWLLGALVTICSIQTFAQTDTISNVYEDEVELESDYENAYEDDSPFLIFLLIIAAVVMLFCFGVGVVVAICIILIILGLLALGVISTSLAVGLHKRSIASGFKTMVITSCTFVGGIVGLIMSYLVYVMISGAGHTAMISLAGGFGGALAGLGFGFLAVFAIRKIAKIISNKYNDNQSQPYIES